MMLGQTGGRLVSMAYREMMLRGYLRRLWYPRYQFQYFPRQLCFLTDCLDRVAGVEGAIVEIGCAHGLTTTFLYEYMVDSGLKKPYVCIDTFSGFTPEDIAVERRERGKAGGGYDLEFKNNRADWFREALGRRHITDIEVIEGDICSLDAARLPERVAFCLLDVDLYRPVKSGLERIFPRLSPGGLIVVDDCWTKPRHMWVESVGDAYDGAMQAYREFVAEQALPPRFAETKLALVERPETMS